MKRYAEQTQVSSEKSRAEIERTLARYGATGFFYGWDGPNAVLGFQAHARRVMFLLPMPDRDDPSFVFTAGRKLKRTQTQIDAAYEQAVRQKWRALALVIKAKLEAVAAGITEFEDEFLAHIVLPGGRTVGAWLRPQLEVAYTTGKMPPMLPG